MWQLIALLLSLLLQAVSASPIMNHLSNAAANAVTVAASAASTVAYSAQSIVIAVAMIVIGLAFCFFGFRLFRVALFLGGAYLFGAIAYFILVNLFSHNVISSDNRDNIVVITLAVVGLLGGLLALFLWRVGVFALGAMGGVFLATWILTWSSDALITSVGGRYAFFIIMGVICGVLALFLQKHVLILATGVAGSASTFLGIDFFAKTGIAARVELILGGDATSSLLTSGSAGVIGMQVGILVLALLGIYCQYRINRGRTWEL